jgi:transcriptional regulator with XRE-family HTH domain
MDNAKTIRIQIGKKLRRMREEAGMSQQKLADLAGMKQSMINRFESGVRKINVDQARGLASVFHIAPAEFLPPDINTPAQPRTPPST